MAYGSGHGCVHPAEGSRDLQAAPARPWRRWVAKFFSFFCFIVFAYVLLTMAVAVILCIVLAVSSPPEFTIEHIKIRGSATANCTLVDEISADVQVWNPNRFLRFCYEDSSSEVSATFSNFPIGRGRVFFFPPATLHQRPKQKDEMHFGLVGSRDCFVDRISDVLVEEQGRGEVSVRIDVYLRSKFELVFLWIGGISARCDVSFDRLIGASHVISSNCQSDRLYLER